MNDWKESLKSGFQEAEQNRQREAEKAKNEQKNRGERSKQARKFLQEIVEPAFQQFKREVEDNHNHSVKISVTDSKAELRVDDGQLLVYTLESDGLDAHVRETYFDGESGHRLADGAGIQTIDQDVVLKSLAAALIAAVQKAP